MIITTGKFSLGLRGMVVSPVNVDEKPYAATAPQDSGVSEAISYKVITGAGFNEAHIRL